MARTPKVVALDRDGTIIVERHYLSSPEQVQLLPGAAEGLKRMRRAGFLTVVVTNQSAVGRGIIDEARLGEIHQRMRELLAEHDVKLDAIYHCPHLPGDACHCRKPLTGMMDRAAREFEFDPREAFMIGDKECDIEMGRRAGARTILVRTGYGVDAGADFSPAPDFIAADLSDAARLIEHALAREVKSPR